MLITYKFKLDTTKNQQQLIDSQVESCRKLYNFFLNQRIYLYHKKGISIKKSDQQRQLPLIKSNKPEYQDISSVVLQDIVDRVDKAFKQFFKRNKTIKTGGFPRFKPKDRYKSMSFSYMGFTLQSRNKIALTHIGHVKYIPHRKVKGTPKKCIIKRTKTGAYMISIVCEIKVKPKKKKLEFIVGIDLGITNFVVTSDNVAIPPDKRNKVRFKRRKRIQRALDCKIKGSKNRKKNRIVLSLAYEKEKNTRRDAMHKLAKSLVRAYDVIVIEDLDIENMLRTGHRSLHRLIQEASWGTFINYLAYKAEKAGKWLIKVDPKNTTQECSGCKNIVRKKLSERTHKCPFCGLTISRDYNASINILHRGLEQIRELITAGVAGIYACGDLANWLNDMINGFGQPKNAPLFSLV